MGSLGGAECCGAVCIEDLVGGHVGEGGGEGGGGGWRDGVIRVLDNYNGFTRF